jgi:hypothetical protein
MGAAKALRSEPEPSPREVLAIAITNYNEAVEKEQASHSATERARLLVAEARKNFNLATSALEEARNDRMAKLVREATGGEAPVIDRFVRQARDKQIAAQDELDAAKAALATIEQSAADWAAEAKRTKEWLEVCVNAVLSSEHERLFAEAQALQAELIDRRIGLQWIVHAMLLPRGPSLPLRRDIDSWLNRNGDDYIPGEARHSPSWKSHPANEPWKAAREALMADATAPLPVK